MGIACNIFKLMLDSSYCSSMSCHVYFGIPKTEERIYWRLLINEYCIICAISPRHFNHPLHTKRNVKVVWHMKFATEYSTYGRLKILSLFELISLKQFFKINYNLYKIKYFYFCLLDVSISSTFQIKTFETNRSNSKLIFLSVKTAWKPKQELCNNLFPSYLLIFSSHAVTNYTQKRISQDFIEEYRKWQKKKQIRYAKRGSRKIAIM